MHEDEFLAERFQAHREHLTAVAYRMLGSLGEAEDAVQETWLKTSRADLGHVTNLGGWLTTVIGRVCLDMLRVRKSRREEPLDARRGEPVVKLRARTDPEAEALLADSVGLAMLVVLDALSPTERLAFVLHDMFAVPFGDIAAVVERSPATTQRLASRARQRVRGRTVDDPDRARRHRAVEAFLTAARTGQFEALLTMLDPDVSFRADEAARRFGARETVSGAREIAEQLNGQARLARPVLMDGEVGVVVAPRGRVLLALRLRFGDDDRITRIEAIADQHRLSELEFTLP